MNYGTHPGWIEVISGVMFSGKSEELIRRVRRAIIARRRVQVFKSHLDSRYAGLYSVSSHDGTELDASPVDSAAEIFRLVRPDTAARRDRRGPVPRSGHRHRRHALAGRGVRVILAGTDTDFRGEPFGAMGELMAVAEVVDKLQAICVVCGDPACRNQRLLDGKPARYDSPTIMVGGRESYEARCRHCHKVPRRDEDQTALLCRPPSLRCSTSPSPATSPPASPPSPSCSGAGAPRSSTPTGWCARRRRPGSPVLARHRRAVRARTCSTPTARSTARRSAAGSWAIPAALADLNRIVHPEVLRRRRGAGAEARAPGRPDRGERHPAAVRGGRPGARSTPSCWWTRRRRSAGPGCWPSAGSPPSEADRMLAAQAPSGPKRARSTYVIDNDGDLAGARGARARGVGRRSLARA